MFKGGEKKKKSFYSSIGWGRNVMNLSPLIPFLLLKTATVHKIQFYRLLVHNVGYVLWRLMLKINAVVQEDLYCSSVKRVQELFKYLLLCSKRKWGERGEIVISLESRKGNQQWKSQFIIQQMASFPWRWGKKNAVTLLALKVYFFNCS